MTTTTKLALSVLAAGAVSMVASATPITGSIGFSGTVTPFANSSATGATVTDYTLAHSIKFGPTLVGFANTGTFTSVAPNSPVTMISFLQVNPTALPIPASQSFWQVTGGGITYTFTLTSIAETLDTPGQLALAGAGTISDNAGDATVTGTWNATFSATGGSFSWAGTSGADVPAVPEASTSLLLLGVSLTALGAYAQFRKQAA